MNNSRTGANVRAKRTTTPAEYAKPQTSPVTSINSQQIFHSNANTTGANARISGSSNKSATQQKQQGQQGQQGQQQQQQQQGQYNDIVNPPAGSKLTIGNAVALITIRLGRLESFMNQQGLDGGNGNNDEILRTVLTRVSALEQKVNSNSNTNSVNSNTNSVNSVNITDALVLSRIVALEENSANHNYNVMSEGLKSLEQTLGEMHSANVAPNSEEIDSLKLGFQSFTEELKEMKDLLLKLQSFTMETNSKLVNTIFSQVDQFDVHEFENESSDFNQYMCADTEDLEEEVEEGEVEGDLEEETKSGIQVNFKEMINQELLGSGY